MKNGYIFSNVDKLDAFNAKFLTSDDTEELKNAVMVVNLTEAGITYITEAGIASISDIKNIV